MNDLTNGDFLGAASSNAMAVVLLVFLAGLWTIWVIRRARGIDAPIVKADNLVLWGVVVGFVVFGVFRDTPWGVWLRP